MRKIVCSQIRFFYSIQVILVSKRFYLSEKVEKSGKIINSPLLKNNGFGEGLSAMSRKAHANLTSPSACHRIYPFYRATFTFSFTFFFYLYFSSSSSYSFFFPFFFFYFSFFLFPFSFFFLFFIFLSLLLPSLLYLFLLALCGGARKGINNYHQFYYNYKNNFPIFKNF
jgi:hypothetical protein